MKKKDVEIKQKDKLSLILNNGAWKYLDVKTKRKIREHQAKKSNESGNKIHPLAPRFMQPDSDELHLKKNFRDKEYIYSAPEGLRGKSNTYELV